MEKSSYDVINFSDFLWFVLDSKVDVQAYEGMLVSKRLSPSNCPESEEDAVQFLDPLWQGPR
jgi:hypothetical protein